MLPVLYGDGFAGRVEAVADARAGTLKVRNLWLEPGVRRTKKLETALAGCLKRFARFNHCKTVEGAAALGLLR